MAKDCRVKLQGEANEVTEAEGVAFMVGRQQSVDAKRDKVTFKLDSGASHHLVNDKVVFKSLEKLEQPVVIGVAKDDQSMIARHRVTICGMNRQGVSMTIYDVLFIPELRANLLSEKRMTKAGEAVSFGPTVEEMRFGQTSGVRMQGFRMDTIATEGEAGPEEQSRGHGWICTKRLPPVGRRNQTAVHIPGRQVL